MEIMTPSAKKIEIHESFDVNKEELFEYISEPYKMTLWLADTVRKIPQGFELSIDLPLHTIENKASIIRKEKPDRFEFLWKSEFVMDKSVVIFSLHNDNPVELIIEEIGDFEGSRWNKSREIHLDLWKNAISKLSNLFS